ncbi:MAG: hypothetical protein LBI59_08025 [Candidatus Accumulibacter sp.]|nr:hypothetical protein [Accumulibacter sp.]
MSIGFHPETPGSSREDRKTSGRADAQARGPKNWSAGVPPAKNPRGGRGRPRSPALFRAGETAGKADGFSLIELRVVCAILATLAFTVWGGYRGVRESAEDEIAIADMRRVADAVRRFKADTGYYPGQGPFVLAETASSEEVCTAKDGILRAWAAHILDGNRNAWFNSPANLGMLFDPPPLCPKHPLAYLGHWNPETGRGWRGPYLDRTLRLWVDVGSDLNKNDPSETGVSTGPDGTGSPLAGAKILDVPAYGSGPRYRASGSTGASCASQAADSGTCMFGWRRVPRNSAGYHSGAFELDLHARPFLLFGLANGDHPRVVYLGPDGVYDGRNPANPCLPLPDADDRVLCLSGG